MNEIQIATMFEEAEQWLLKAESALCRPQEDIVSEEIIQSSFHATVLFLAGYLTSQGYDVAPNTHPKDLWKACSTVDTSFSEIELDILAALLKKVPFYLSFNELQTAVNIARNAKAKCR